MLYLGAVPVLCDVEPASGNIDVVDAERRLDSSVKGIIPVHLYGQPADMEAVTALADRYDLAIIEDAAQAIGARYRGKPVGSFGLLGCFSFYPGKNLGAAREAGLVTTNDSALAKGVRALRNHSQSERYTHTELGFNFRMEGFQGLILGDKLSRLDAWTEQRRSIARRYDAGLTGLPLAATGPAASSQFRPRLSSLRDPLRAARRTARFFARTGCRDRIALPGADPPSALPGEPGNGPDQLSGYRQICQRLSVPPNVLRHDQRPS